MGVSRRGFGVGVEITVFVILGLVYRGTATIDTDTGLDLGFLRQLASRGTGNGPTWPVTGSPVKPWWLRDKGIYDDLDDPANAAATATPAVSGNGSVIAIDKKKEGARARVRKLEAFLRSCETDEGKRLRQCRTPLLRDGDTGDASPNQFREQPEVRPLNDEHGMPTGTRIGQLPTDPHPLGNWEPPTP